jgi:murein L,D-transpeptidase YafK
MRTTSSPCLALVFLAFACASPGGAKPAEQSRPDEVRRWTSWRAPSGLAPAARVALAYKEKEAVVRRLLADAGLPYPPVRVLLRVFKEESVVEVWAAGKASEALVRVAVYLACDVPPEPGPKSRQGDGRVPEGFYRIDGLNSASAFHLSMHVSYPNAWDRRRSTARALGGDIMIHGNCVSIGCVAMTDERIQELWVLVEPVIRRGGEVHVASFPGRDLAGYIAGSKDPELASFWKTLKEGNDRFEATRRIPKPILGEKGYTFR